MRTYMCMCMCIRMCMYMRMHMQVGMCMCMLYVACCMLHVAVWVNPFCRYGRWMARRAASS